MDKHRKKPNQLSIKISLFGIAIAILLVVGVQSTVITFLRAAQPPATLLSNAPLLGLPEYILKYAEFHRKQLQDPSTAKYLVYRCRTSTGKCGGIGDRIMGIVATFYVAMATDRVFLIDYEHPFPLTDTFLPALVDWRLPQGINLNFADNQLFMMDQHALPHLWDSDRVIVFQGNQFSDKLALEYRPLQRYLKRFDIDVVNNPENAPRVLTRDCWMALFRRNAALREAVKKIRSQAGLLPNQPYVSVHMRIGTNWDDPQRHNLTEVLPKFFECAVNMQRVLGRRHSQTAAVPVYVASDLESAKKELIERKGSSFLAVMDLETFHVDRSGIQPGQIVAARRGYMSAWAEFFILVDAECSVESNSGFSTFARAISMDRAGRRCYAAVHESCSIDTIKAHITVGAQYSTTDKMALKSIR